MFKFKTHKYFNSLQVYHGFIIR